MHVYLKAFEL